jgi:hypothetical protein
MPNPREGFLQYIQRLFGSKNANSSNDQGSVRDWIRLWLLQGIKLASIDTIITKLYAFNGDRKIPRQMTSNGITIDNDGIHEVVRKLKLSPRSRIKQPAMANRTRQHNGDPE